MTATRPRRGLSRRQFMPRALAVAAAGIAGVVGYELPRGSSSAPRRSPSSPSGATSDPSGSSGPGSAQSFVTRPDLRPPPVRVTRPATEPATGPAPRFIFLAPTNVEPGTATQEGLMMLDRDGRLVWFSPVSYGQPFDLNVQSDGGRPVLTWWQGDVRSAHGYGAGEIGNDAYHPVTPIHAGDGLQTDLHDLRLTSAGTALVTAYETVRTDLSSLGGSRQNRTFVGHVQEIDLTTGRVLFDWRSLDHVGVDESYAPLPGNHADAYDYFHINSVDEMEDGNLLVSARNTCALYKVDRSNGRVLWRLNGKRSDFRVSSAARFYWQHDARAHGASTITVFDNAGPQKEKASRAVLLSVDPRAMTVDLTRAYVHPASFLSNTQGNMQLLGDGGVFVGWGDQPYFSQFAADGTLVLDGQLPVGVRSYRAYAADWVGHPADAPRMVAQANPVGGFAVRASWNGATEVARWTVLAGRDKSSLSAVGSQAWTGFETEISVNSQGPAFGVVALDSRGRELGRSEVV